MLPDERRRDPRATALDLLRFHNGIEDARAAAERILADFERTPPLAPRASWWREVIAWLNNAQQEAPPRGTSTRA